MISHWLQTRHTIISLFYRATKSCYIIQNRCHILIIQRDLTAFSRFCVKSICLEAVTGRLNGAGWVIWQCHKGIVRKGKGDASSFGANDKSCIVSCFVEKLIAWYKHERIDIPPPAPTLNKVGVYVDEPASILTYYSISDTNTLRHLPTFNTTFTEPFYAGFVLYNASVSLCDAKIYQVLSWLSVCMLSLTTTLFKSLP